MHLFNHDWENTPALRRATARVVGLLYALALLLPWRGQAQMASGVLREIYTGLTGSSLSSLTNNSSFPNSPTTNEIMSGLWEGPGNFGDYYGDRYRALLVPPVSGSYTFWVQGDDAAVLYLSTDESPNNRVQVAYNTTTALFRAWYTYPSQQTPSFYLEAGRHYYIEAIHSAGSGDDAFAVGWKLPDGSYEQPMTTTYLYPYGLPAISKPVITQQPTNLAVLEQIQAQFRVSVSNFDAVTYQWQRNNTNLVAARGATLVLPPVTLADSGSTFRCVISNSFGAVTSTTVSLNVSADAVAPALVEVLNLSTNAIQVYFSEPVGGITATNPLNYTLSGGATISSASMGANNATVVLRTTGLQRGSNYTLTVNNVRDISSAANLIATNSQKSFTALLKGLYREIYTDISGSFLKDLTNSPTFPNSPSKVELVTNVCETASFTLNSYGQRLRGLVVAPSTGTYTFWIAAHDSATLSLGSSSLPESAQVIASVTRNGDVASREWNIQPNQQSAPVSLVAGQQYYFEVLMKSGISQQFPPDHLAVRWQLPNGTIEEPMSAAHFTPVGLNLPTLTLQPTNTTVMEGSAVTFSVAASNLDPVTYQWQQNGTNLVNATNVSLTLTVGLTNNNFSYRCLVSNAHGTTNSATAVLSVIADNVRPTIVSVVNSSSNKVLVTFSELVDAATAATTANYSIAGIGVASPSLSTNGRTVTLNTSPMLLGNSYTITVNRVRDRAATYNVIATNTQFTFVASDFFPTNIGAASGSSTPLFGGADVIGGNNDFSGTNDVLNFAYQRRVGDFDIKVRVARLDFADAWSTATLMAREDVNGTNRYAAVCATPSIAGCFFQYRTNNATIPGNSGSFPVNYPYTWLRLQRTSGQFFSGYASVDGITWTRLGTITISASATMYVGFGVTSRNATNTTLAQFRDFGDNSNTNIGFTTANVEPLGASSRRTGLVFTELMYHPAPRADARKTEFVELHNSYPFAEDLSGYRISGDISYTFPKGTIIPGGAFIVIARSPADIAAVYGLTNRVMGPYTNSFSNKRGTVRLRNPMGAILLEVNYDSDYPWPLAPDGTGHSLVLVRPSLGENHPEAWARSDSIGGSPGRVDGVLFEPARNVVINEFLAHTDLPDVDYIELYNHGTTPVDVSGCWLSDDPFTNKFRIPDGTVIGATGFVHFTEAQLGFSLSAEGEAIYFLNSNRTCVVDSFQFDGQENGVSMGRVPDGGSEWYRLASKTAGSRNSAIRQKQIVINEIMYHPVTDDDNDTFIELYNRGPGSVNIGGWRFTDGIDFTFPTNVIVASNGYVVVAKNAARLMSNYANLNTGNTFGNFEGTLSGSGEHIAISIPDYNVVTNGNGTVQTNKFWIPVDELTYGTGGRWSKWSDGGGSSLELVDPRVDNRLSGNWADSDDTSKSAWSTLSVTGYLDNAADGNSQWNALQLYLLEEGECLIDNVTFRHGPSIGSLSLNIVTNGGFENNGLLNWAAQGDHRYSFLENTGDASAHSLHVVAQDRGDTGANRIYNQLVEQYTTNEWGVLTARVKWLHGRPEIIFRLRGNHLELAGVMPVPKNLGTPGARNSRATNNAPPAITDIAPNPVLPGANDPVVISARVSDPDDISSVQLFWRYDPFPLGTNVVTMNDSGTNGDAIPGDGIYSVRIAGQVNDTMLAFYVRATDTLGASSRFPNDAPNRECLLHFGETQPIASFASYRFWMTQKTLDDWQTHDKFSSELYQGTFVYGNSRVIYNAASHYAGSPAHAKLYDSPMGTNCDYQLILPKDDALLDETSLRIQEPGLFGADRTCQNESLGYWLIAQMGVPALNRRPVNVFVNGMRRGTIYEDTQRQNKSFNEQWYPNSREEDNDLYRIGYWYEFGNEPITHRNDTAPSLRPWTTTNSALKLAVYRQMFNKRAIQTSPHNYTNLFKLVDVLNTTSTGDQYAAEVFPWMDVSEWSRAFAAERILNNTDLYGARRIVSATETKPGAQNSFLFKPGGDTWKFLIWDIDAAFLGTPVDPLFDFTDPPVSNFFAHPYVLRTYWQALQDAANGPLRPENLWPVMDAKYVAFQNAGLTVNAPDGMKNYLGIRRDYILHLLSQNDPLFAITSNGGNQFTVGSTLAPLSGVAPFGVRTITINDVAYPVSWSSVSNWTVLIPLTTQVNNLVVKGLDANGNVITNATRSITIFFNGPVARAEDSLVINKVMFQPAVSNAHYVEIFNRSTNTTFSLAGFRLKGVDFDFGPQHIIQPLGFYVVVKDFEVFDAVYGATAPIAGEYNGDLDRDGETLQLVRLARNTNETDVVISKMKYQITAPWPARPGMTNSGVPLQLVDASKDNARVSNWDDGSGWKFFSYTGRPQSQRLAVWLESAAEIYIDEMSLVLGDVPGAGPNLIVNGNFESGFASWSFLNTYDGKTGVTNSFPKFGTNCLRFSPTKSGSSGTSMIQDIIPTLSSSSNYTISFWFKAATNNTANNLWVRIGGSQFQGSTSVRPVAAQPGVMNPMASTLLPYPSLWINEVQPNNVNTLLDNTGVPQPWIELFNNGTNTIQLDGLSLSKSYTNLNMWSFPANTFLAPGQFRVVFVDGNPLLSTGSVLHTSFRLDPTNGSIVLSLSNQILDYINFGALAPDQSYGSTPDGQLFTRQPFFFPTPGASNNAAPVPVVINEWMASNTKTTNDPWTSQFEDWFELYNAFTQPIDISGYFITNEKDNPDKWQVPAGTVIPPHGFLLCWADNAPTNNITIGNALHTSFKLNKGGDYLALYTPDLRLVDHADFGAQTNDMSEGRYPDGNVAGVFYKMRSATPRTNNIIATNGYAPILIPAPNFTVNEGMTVTFTNRAFDADLPAQVLTFSLAPGAPEGAQVDPNTGVFTWQTMEVHGPAVYPITVVVSDNSSPAYTDTKTFQVTVNESNTPPSINAIADRTTYADTPVALSVIVTDVDLPAQAFSYSLLAAPATASINASGLFTWTPTAADAGTTNPVTVKVSDNGTPSLSATQSFLIFVNAGIACPGIKGDVSPRGAPNGSVGSADFTLIGRFYAKLTNILDACELARADVAPAPCGDGRITLSDWVVAGRLVAHLDATNDLSNCNGTNYTPHFAPAKKVKSLAGARSLSFTNTTMARGATNWISIILDSQGDEIGGGFDFIFDTNYLTYVGYQPGKDAPSAFSFDNGSELGSGMIGLTVLLDAGTTFAAGKRELVKVGFRVSSGSNTVTTPLVFADGPEVPISPEIDDVNGFPLPFGYVNGSARLISDAGFHFTQFERQTDGVVHLQMQGPSGVWELQSSSNLFNWNPLWRFTNSSGEADYLDSSATNVPQRFYKAVKQ